MRQSWGFLLSMIMIASITLLFFGIHALPEKDEKPTEYRAADVITTISVPSVDFANPSIGPLDARMQIVEFGDFTCQQCAAMHDVLSSFMELHPNDVRLVWKDFPNIDHNAEASNAALAARCAGIQGGFWNYHDVLFENQTSINQSSYDIFAELIDLNMDDFRTCVSNSTTTELVDRDFVEGQRLQIDATPYFFIDGRRFSGAISMEQLDLILNSTPTP